MEMTQAKLKSSDTEEIKKNVEQKKETNTKYLSDKCVQIAAWVLLSLGLCIIVSTFYLAIKQRDANDFIDNEEFNDIENGDRNKDDMNVKIISRGIDDRIVDLQNGAFTGCETKYCKTICTGSSNVFQDLFESMESSNCSLIDMVLVYKQSFKFGILRNYWQYGERSVQEVALVDSKITVIKNAAFNTPMFSTTFLLFLRNLKLKRVESAALLGLHSLKYLIIDTKIECLDRAFFQPVQTTLTVLKIHADLKISTNESVFGISEMNKLEYVDLSKNNINGCLTNISFGRAPNIKTLKLSKNKITAVNPDAFIHLNNTLNLLDLSNNMLKTLSSEVLEPLLTANDRLMISLTMNNWACNCEIVPLIGIYNEYRSQFMDALYCRAPHRLYGKFINEVEIDTDNCDLTSSTISDTRSDEMEYSTASTPFVNDTRSSESSEYTDISTSMETPNIQLRCWSMYESDSNSSPDRSKPQSTEFPSSEITTVDTDGHEQLNLFVEKDLSYVDISGLLSYTDYFDFERPQYEFSLHLYENYSVKVTVSDFMTGSQEIHIIWFGEDIEEFAQKSTACLRYANPFVITEILNTNETYTFCYVYASIDPVSPFNCLPLHVPAAREAEEDIWIPREQKAFTIGILCLIFLISIFSGAIMAYFAIKTYPDLLEGSKNVLVVKKSDKTCYVSTISDSDCKRKNSYKKKTSNSSMHKSIIPNQFMGTISRGSTSASDLTRLSSVKSSSTCFEDDFPSIPSIRDEYELPKPIEKSQLNYESQCIPNTYVATSPRSPPPLPKRNSKSFTENIY